MRTCPSSGGSRVARIEISVVFPAPFGPSRPKISPSRTAKLTPLRTARSPYRLTNPQTSIIAFFAQSA
jgi:hypothetical protein